MLTKREQRGQVLTNLKQMSKQTYITRSHKIVERLLLTSQFQFAKTIAVTMSNFPEVETRFLIEQAWALRKTIVVPKSHPQSKTMTFYELTDFRELEIVFADIEEPIPARCREVKMDSIELVIVPGVVFNEAGYRIGFGGGFYDRFLANYQGHTIALAFDEQIQPTIVVDAHDIAVQTIVTDQRMLTCSEE